MQAPDTFNWFLKIIWPSLPIGVIFALLLNYGLYYFFFKSKVGTNWMSSRKHYKHIHTKAEILYEIRHAIIPESILSFITGVALATKDKSPFGDLFKIRWDMNAAEIPRIILEVIGIFIVYEIYYYTVHYLMHKRRIYKYTHAVHHKSLYPTPQTGTSVNLLEAIIFYTFFTLLIFGPFHILSLILISLEIKFASLTQHLGHEIFPRWVRTHPLFKYFNSTRFHQLHHSDKLNKNFGFQTSFLDRGFKTINPAYLEYEKNQ